MVVLQGRKARLSAEEFPLSCPIIGTEKHRQFFEKYSDIFKRCVLTDSHKIQGRELIIQKPVSWGPSYACQIPLFDLPEITHYKV
jgi:flagellar assembly factor FliW